MHITTRALLLAAAALVAFSPPVVATARLAPKTATETLPATTAAAETPVAPEATAVTMAVTNAETIADTTPSAGPALHSVLRLGFGYGQYGNILHGGAPSPLFLLPRWQLYSGRFYVENLDLGFNLLSNGGFALDLSTQQSLDALLLRPSGLKAALLGGILNSPVPLPLPFDADPATLLTPQRRHLSYLGGLTAYYQTKHWQLTSAWQQDISGVHHGAQWLNELSYRQRLALPGLPVDSAIQLSAGWRQLSRAYSNYYFAVKPQDSTGQLYLYQPGARTVHFVKLAASSQLTTQLSLVLNWKREFLPDAYQQSLFFRSRQHDVWFTGFFYQF